MGPTPQPLALKKHPKGHQVSIMLFFYHSVKTTFIMSYIYILLLQTLIFSYNVHLCSFKLSGRSGGHDHLRRKWVWWLWNGKAARYVLCNILMFCKIPNAQPYLMCPNILYNWDIVHQWYHVSFFFCFVSKSCKPCRLYPLSSIGSQGTPSTPFWASGTPHVTAISQDHRQWCQSVELCFIPHDNVVYLY